MDNYRKAPKLYHDVNKSKLDNGMFISIPQKVLRILFTNLDGKCGNQIKLIMMLCGTIGNGKFAISEKWIMNMCGFSQPCYIRARQELVKKGWLEVSGGKITVKISKILACYDNMEESEEPCDDANNPCCDTQEACYDTENECCDSIPNTKVNNNNNKEKDKDEFSDFYFNLSNYYFIQMEEVKRRIDKKLPDNIDRLDILTFWINIKDELALIRNKQKINDKCALEYDASIVLNKYNEYREKPALSGYKMYKKDMIRIHDKEFFEKFWGSLNTNYFYFRTDAPEIRYQAKEKYQLSTYMFYRNAQEALLEKKKKQEVGEYDPKDY